jgi:hypothetical protein
MRSIFIFTLCLAGCALPATGTAQTSTTKRATFPGFETGPALTFMYPSSWNVYRPAGYTFSFVSVFAYLGNVPLSDPCTHIASGTEASLSCNPFPMHALASGAIVARWGEIGCVVPGQYKGRGITRLEQWHPAHSSGLKAHGFETVTFQGQTLTRWRSHPGSNGPHTGGSDDRRRIRRRWPT